MHSINNFCFSFLFEILTEHVPSNEICMIELDDEKVKAFTYAVKNNYWYPLSRLFADHPTHMKIISICLNPFFYLKSITNFIA